ncbi:LamG-like jellyroll fold domain-containing protein [Rubinisphaera margarita]|uniref:LamG-like jellyroll fold domain-containing protein n=1 Tax=Rubinisphaera margarita TaxID=2909586 RepID=UPI001EE7F3DE|nr:LamG-like jellyroll fold domain-containing protein [Rubinisphaera margarita]MCG6154394.1 FecR domain-containing protein [Rubinisphaera margarita]
MDDNIRQLIFQAIDQTISPEDFDRLQDAIEQDSEVRTAYLRAVHMSGTLEDLASESDAGEKTDAPAVHSNPTAKRQRGLFNSRLSATWNWLAAAAVLLAVGGTAFWFGQRNQSSVSDSPIAENDSSDGSESRIAGHATLRHAIDLQWPSDAVRRVEGDVLPNGSFAFEEGVAEIDFFCGATLIVEGPAELEIESDWSVRVIEGRLRAMVPPAARGFIVKAADSEIVDLGTEFALSVGDGNSQVEVIDGEIELRGGEFHEERLLTGESRVLAGEKADAIGLADIPTASDMKRRHGRVAETRFNSWQAASQKLRQRSDLIGYFTAAEMTSERFLPNVATHGVASSAFLSGPVTRTSGRFGELSPGLDFSRPGARLRMQVDGEFEAFTFACWARIDSLDHRYNALFMGDGYENGEPHWQIRDDGRVMFSVMVDDSQEVRLFSKVDQKIVHDAGLHRVYMTEPIWNSSMSGQWLHLAAVFDPASRRVTQYLNGQPVSHHPIEDKFLVTRLRIGPAEIGNWGQPFRDSPWFAVRNLNGTIDELAIFNEALADGEIRELYEQGKPLGY